MGSRMASRTAGVAALLSSLALAAAGDRRASRSAQTVPMPVPAPQPKSHGRAAAPRPAGGAGAARSSRRGRPSRPPAAFPRSSKPPALFGKSGATTAFDAKQRALVDRVSAYLSGVRQLHGKFVQVGPDGGKSEGEFYLQKPGKVRFEYNPPSPIELIADGSSVVVRDRKLATQDLYPLSQTPLRFLLADRIDLLRDTNLIGVYADDVFVTVVIEETPDHRRHPPADDDVRRAGQPAAAMDRDRPAGLRHHRRGLQSRRQAAARPEHVPHRLHAEYSVAIVQSLAVCPSLPGMARQSIDRLASIGICWMRRQPGRMTFDA